MQLKDVQPGSILYWETEPVKVDSVSIEPDYGGVVVHIIRFAASDAKQNGYAIVSASCLHTKPTQYVSFCGTFEVPENNNELSKKFPLQYEEIFEGTDSLGEDRYREVSTGFRDGLTYETINGKDSLTVYLAKIDDSTGHLVASCRAGGWADETFVFLNEHGKPVKSANNFNPNPVEQLCEEE